MRGLVVLIVLLVVLVGGAVLLSRSVPSSRPRRSRSTSPPMHAAHKLARQRLGLTLSVLLAAGVAGAALAQSQPESILPPGFGDPRRRAAAADARRPRRRRTGPRARAGEAPRARRAPDLSRIEDIIESAGLDDAGAPAAVAPPVEYRDDRRRDPALAGVIWPAAIGYTGERVGQQRGQVPVGRAAPHRRAAGVALGADRAAQHAAGARPRRRAAIDPADWVAERAWLLLKLGEADAARLLVASIDTDTFTPKMVQVAAQVALANSDPSGLCAIETELAKVEPQIAPLVSAMCASLAGESERAAADIEQARRRGRVERDRPCAGRQGRRRGRRHGARGDDRMGAGRRCSARGATACRPRPAMMPPERLIDARRAAGARLAGARADVRRAAEDGGGADRGGDGGDVVRRDGRPLCGGL